MPFLDMNILNLFKEKPRNMNPNATNVAVLITRKASGEIDVLPFAVSKDRTLLQARVNQQLPFLSDMQDLDIFEGIEEVFLA